VSSLADIFSLNLSPDTKLYLLLSTPQDINAMSLMVVKKILEVKCTPLVISLNQPCQVLAKSYAKEGISPDQYYVIDAVTHYSGGTCLPNAHTRYVNHPADLTSLGIAITEFLHQMPSPRKCIVFDSVSMLLIHIPSATASKFLQFVVNKLKISEVSGVFLCVENGLDPTILSQMSAFVDKIVNYDEQKNPLLSKHGL
jgi:KaiC/GvpD/RAD55 family RecA-like ATPase